MSDRLVRETGNKAPANATADENAWLRLALRAIEGPADSGPFIEAYRDAGGGYEGLQAVATFALESVGREPASARPAPDGQGSDQSPGPEPSTESWGSNQSENSRVVGEREERLREGYDASNAVRLCDRCEAEQGVGAGADAGDRACSACGSRDAPHIYPALASSPSPPDRDDFALRIQSALDAIYDDAEVPLQWDELGERVAEHVFGGDES